MEAIIKNFWCIAVINPKCDGSEEIMCLYLPEAKAFIYDKMVVPLTTHFTNMMTRYNSGNEKFTALLAIDDFKKLYEDAVKGVAHEFEEGQVVWRKAWRNGRENYSTFIVGPVAGYMFEGCKIDGSPEKAIRVVREFIDSKTGEKETRPEADYKPVLEMAESKILDKVVRRIKKDMELEGVLGVRVALAGNIYAL